MTGVQTCALPICFPVTIPIFSRINSLENKSEFAPELLITIGHSVICKQLKIFLRAHQPAEQWQLESSLPYVDTYKSLTTVIPGFATDTLDKMPLDKTESNFSDKYNSEYQQIKTLHNKFVDPSIGGLANPLSDMNVVMELLQQTPSGTTLHLANSTAVR